MAVALAPNAFLARTASTAWNVYFSWCGWRRIDVDRGQFTILAYLAHLNIGSGFQLTVDPDRQLILFDVDDFTDILGGAGPTIPVGEWWFFGISTVAASAPDNIEVYYAPAGAGSLTQVTTTLLGPYGYNWHGVGARPGADGSDGAFRLHGSAAHDRTWSDITLSPAEMLAEFESDVPVRSGAWSSWPMEDAATATVDATGQSRPLTATPGTGSITDTDGPFDGAAAGTADLALTVALGAVGEAVHAGTADLSLTVALAAAGQAGHAGAADLPTAVSLTAEGQAVHAGTADLALDLALAAAGQTGHAGAADLPVDVALAAAGLADRAGTADLSLTVALAAAGDSPHGGTADLALTVALAAAGNSPHGGTADLELAVALAGVGDAPAETAGTADLQLGLALAAQGQASHAATADLPASLVLAAVGQASHAAAADLPAVLSLAAVGSVPHGGTAALGLTASLAAAGVAPDENSTGTADLQMDLSLAAVGQSTPGGTVDLNLDVSLAAVGSVPHSGTAELGLGLALTAVGPPTHRGSAEGCPWPIDLSCCTGLTQAQQDPDEVARWQAVASTLLWGQSGRRWGPCEPVTARPCGRSCIEAALGAPVGWGTVGGRWVPYSWGGRWYNASLCGCRAACSCTELSEVYLEGPVYDIREVWVDGALVPSHLYRVDYTERGTMLVRTDGGRWPACSDIAAACDQPGSFCVRYRIGLPLGPAAVAAVSEMTCELIKAACGAPGCRLPGNTQRVVRQGVTIELETVDGLFDLPLVKAWLDVVNPGRLPAPCRVYSTNMRRPRYTPFG